MIRRSRGSIWTWLDRRRIERLAGVTLPRNAQELRYVDWQPSGDLAYHEALIRFRISFEDYLGWTRSLDLKPASGIPPEGAAIWLAPPEITTPAWWDASADFTPATVREQIGQFGVLVMKWERGAAYVHIVDTGHAATDMAASPRKAY